MKTPVKEYLKSSGVYNDGSDPIDLSKVKEEGFVSAYEYLKVLGFDLKKSKELVRSQNLICGGEPVDSLEELIEVNKVKIKLA
jgi:hypothetical protein